MNNYPFALRIVSILAAAGLGCLANPDLKATASMNDVNEETKGSLSELQTTEDLSTLPAEDAAYVKAMQDYINLHS